MKARIWFASVSCCMAVIVVACQQQPRSKPITTAALKAEVDARLAQGSTSSDVEAFLGGKGMTHSGLIDNSKLAHIGADPNTFEIKSLVRGTRSSALVTTDTPITFVFDREKKLIDTRVAEVHTGL